MVLQKAKNAPHLTMPVSRLDKGETAEILSEVAEAGIKIVIKNNEPACVLLSPKKYEEMMEEMEDAYLCRVVEERLTEDARYIPEKDFWKAIGITEADIDAADDLEIE